MYREVGNAGYRVGSHGTILSKTGKPLKPFRVGTGHYQVSCVIDYMTRPAYDKANYNRWYWRNKSKHNKALSNTLDNTKVLTGYLGVCIMHHVGGAEAPSSQLVRHTKRLAPTLVK